MFAETMSRSDFERLGVDGEAGSIVSVTDAQKTARLTIETVAELISFYPPP